MANSAVQGPCSSRVRVLGEIRPYTKSQLQGLKGGDGGQGVPDLFWESEEQEVPQGTLVEEAG
jgi:hypothetical protein